MTSVSRRLVASVALLSLVVVSCGGADPEAEDTTTTAGDAAETTAGGDEETTTTAGEEPMEEVELTFLVDDTQVTQDRAQGLVDAYTEMHSNVTISLETRPGGGEGDNIVKTRLATGEMNDLFWYNSGSLFQALNPTETMVPLTGEPFLDSIAESYLPTVSADGDVYGVPGETAMGGGILYNKAIYADLGLEVPSTWDEFAANNQAIAEAGIAPVGQTYADTWTSQLFVLGDYYNIHTENPDWADEYTSNEAKYVDQPALTSFQRLQEGFESGWWQDDFEAATFDDGLNMLAAGEIAHYPMLTFALGAIAENHPDAVEDIGFFGQPGDDASNHGATIWMPASIYIANTTEHPDVAIDFLSFVASVEGTEALTAAVAPTGPYLIDGSTLPADTLPAVIDLQGYIDSGASAPALEFLSPIKGPNLEHLTVQAGSGISSAEEAAALYDQDVVAQAQQLGLPGWDE